MIEPKLLEAVVGPAGVITDAATMAQYGRDWLRDFEPRPGAVVLPATIGELQEVVRICAQHRWAMVPSGGRTGLSGGAAATNGEVVISSGRLAKLGPIDPVDQTVVCEAGVVTQHLRDEVLRHGLYFPLDFASKGSSHIGGNVATNAGGIHVIRYGTLRDWVLGLKVVTADGELLTLNGSLFKNQAGYDLRGLFIGSEGTLGIIAEVTLRLTRPPSDFTRVMCGLDDTASILTLLTAVRREFHVVNAFEFMTRRALEAVMHHTGARDPFAASYRNYVIVELELPTGMAGPTFTTQLEEFFGAQLSDAVIADVVVSQSAKQAQDLMALRENITESAGAHHLVHKNDISVPVPRIAEFIHALEALLAREYPEYGTIIFGHAGDGNLHLSILKPPHLGDSEFFARCKVVDAAIFSVVRDFHGSISAEHGVGLLKREFLHYTRSSAEIALMRQIKRAFDPLGLLNPGKVFA